MPRNLKPGESAPKAGKYDVKGPRGGDRGSVTMERPGHTMPPPPTPGSGQTFKKKGR